MGSQAWRRRRARAGAVLFGAALAVILGEVSVRVLHDRLTAALGPALSATLSSIAYRPHPYLNWELKPGAVMRSGERVNVYGRRGPERPIEKAPGVYRVVCLGGSTTFTTGVHERETYPAMLELELQRVAPNLRVEVVNGGIPGYTTAESFLNLALRLLDHQPDAVVVYHACNDYRVRTWDDYRRDYRHYRRVWVEEDCQLPAILRAAESSELFRLVRMVTTEHARETGLYHWVSRVEDAPAFRPAPPPRALMEGFEANLGAIVDVCEARGIGVTIVSQCYNRDLPGNVGAASLGDMNRAAERLAAARGVTFCDAAEDFPTRGMFRPLDPVHMTSRGAAELGRRVAASIGRAPFWRRAAPPSRVPPTSEDAPSVSDAPPTKSSSPRALTAEARTAIREQALFVATPSYAYRLAPGIAEGQGFGPHDARGLRGESAGATLGEESALADDDRPADRRVLCLGGASTYGLGVAEQDCYPRVLERLAAGATDARVEVLNGGVPGYTTADSIGAFHFHLRTLKPDVVVISHDAEDAAPQLVPGFRTDYAHWRRTFRSSADPPRRWAVPTEAGVDPLGCGAPPESLRASPLEPSRADSAPRLYALYRNLLTLVDLARATGATVLLVEATSGSSPFATSAANRWNRAAAEVSGERGVTLIAAEERVVPEHFDPDCDWLPVAEGHRARARRILPFVLSTTSGPAAGAGEETRDG